MIDSKIAARVAAIDPGSRKAGMVVLQIQAPPAGFLVPAAGEVSILARHTARPRCPKNGDFALRMSELLDIIERWVDDARRHWAPTLWCVEDPRDITPGKQLRGRGAIVSLGAGFGIACAALMMGAHRTGDDVTLVPADAWYPKTRSGGNRNRIHNMKHNAARAFLRERWPALQVCTDDETFAAGVALWAYTRGAMAATYPI
jgi:hypothetical protein